MCKHGWILLLWTLYSRLGSNVLSTIISDTRVPKWVTNLTDKYQNIVNSLGYVGNQNIGCNNRPGICPDGTECDENADCIKPLGNPTLDIHHPRLYFTPGCFELIKPD